MIRLSFILPCYNVDRYVAACLDSIYAQDMQENEYEVICVNDCSTDNTRNVILSYADRHPNLSLIDHHENQTVGGARNSGMKAARGEFIWFVDPDDAVKENSLNELYWKARETDVDVLFFNYEDADETLQVQRVDRTYPDSDVYSGQEYVSHFFPGRMTAFGIVWRELFRTSFLKKAGLQFPNMQRAEDVVFLWKTLLCADRVCSVSKAFYTYRNNPFSITKRHFVAQPVFCDRIRRGAEIVRMMDGERILPVLANDMRRNIRWCACSNVELLLQMSEDERKRYYAEIVRYRDAVDVVRPYMNRKNRIVFNTFGGRSLWLLKVGLLCGFERRKRR